MVLHHKCQSEEDGQWNEVEEVGCEGCMELEGSRGALSEEVVLKGPIQMYNYYCCRSEK